MKSEITKVTCEEAEDQIEQISALLGVNGHDELGGGLVGFVFAHPTKQDVTLTFGYAQGPLGHSEFDDATGQPGDCGDMPEDGPHDAAAQADYIKSVCARLGYVIPTTDGR
ncbi:MAG: hypothetical protein KGZ65_04130 [Sphingomonadales bacterium]|nr:hypothetical protein [Sphingomonadaceae bacterium]MBS3930401.1 hypothetical protein [Sphingomonadales bacterium]